MHPSNLAKLTSGEHPIRSKIWRRELTSSFTRRRRVLTEVTDFRPIAGDLSAIAQRVGAKYGKGCCGHTAASEVAFRSPFSDEDKPFGPEPRGIEIEFVSPGLAGFDAGDAALGRRQIAADVFRPTGGLTGYQGKFLADTRGTGAMSRLFQGYAPCKGVIKGRRNGELVSTADGVAVADALWNLEERGGGLAGAAE